MKHPILLTLLFCCLLASSAFAQQNNRRVCGFDKYVEDLKARDPGFEARVKAIEDHAREYIRQHGSANPTRAVITIPCVVHVVYANPTQNITDTQVWSQIDVLNEDFRKLNADTVLTPTPFKPVATDYELEFCLASSDPMGMPTNGIIRTSTSHGPFNTNDDVKHSSTGGSDAWPADQYLNLWVADLGSGLLGYAQPPGGNPATDGVVCAYQSFGRVGNVAPPYHLGRTATHEIGHWLNLQHTWGGGGCTSDDQVADTPMQDSPNFGCETFPHISCSNGPDGDMFMNYMDYSDDACFSLFTTGQKARSMPLFAPGGAREGILMSMACGEIVQIDAGVLMITAPFDTLCGGSFDPSFVMVNTGDTTLNVVTITYSVDGNSNVYTWTGSLDTMLSTNITLPTQNVGPGVHTLTISTSNPNGSSDTNPGNDQQALSFYVLNSAGLAPPFTESFEISYPPAGWTFNNPDGAIGWTHFTLSGSQSPSSVFMDNYNYNAPGQIDEFTIPGYNLGSLTNPALSFDVAYALYAQGGTSDTLEVLISIDCGLTFFPIAKYFAPGLVTAPPTPLPFIPIESQWRKESIDLSPYAGVDYVEFKFRSITAYENNLYLDNINLTLFPTGLNDSDLRNRISVFPNPASDLLNVVFDAAGNGGVSYSLTDITGRKLLQSAEAAISGRNAYRINVGEYPAGVYLLHFSDGASQITEKVVLK